MVVVALMYVQTKTEKYLREKIEDEGGLHLSLIDPFKQTPEEGARIAVAAYEGKSDAILVGSTTGTNRNKVDRTIELIKEKIEDIPVIIFPGNVAQISDKADAIYLMSLINSMNPNSFVKDPARSLDTILDYDIDPIPVAYILVEPGGSTTHMGSAELIPRNKPELARIYACWAAVIGFHFVLTDAGSGAPEPIPLDFIQTVKDGLIQLKQGRLVPYICAGGIKTPEQARMILQAGADGIQIGTAIEQCGNFGKIRTYVEKMVQAVREGGKSRSGSKRFL